MSTDKTDEKTTAVKTHPLGLTAGRFGTILFLLIALPCFLSLPWTLGTPSTDDAGHRYNDLRYDAKVMEDGKEIEIEIQEQPPGMVRFTRSVVETEGEEAVIKTYSAFEPMGTDQQGRSLFVRCLLGGAVSLGVGLQAALVLAVLVGALGWRRTLPLAGGVAALGMVAPNATPPTTPNIIIGIEGGIITPIEPPAACRIVGNRIHLIGIDLLRYLPLCRAQRCNCEVLQHAVCAVGIASQVEDNPVRLSELLRFLFNRAHLHST